MRHFKMGEHIKMKIEYHEVKSQLFGMVSTLYKIL